MIAEIADIIYYMLTTNFEPKPKSVLYQNSGNTTATHFSQLQGTSMFTNLKSDLSNIRSSMANLIESKSAIKVSWREKALSSSRSEENQEKPEFTPQLQSARARVKELEEENEILKRRAQQKQILHQTQTSNLMSTIRNLERINAGLSLRIKQLESSSRDTQLAYLVISARKVEQNPQQSEPVKQSKQQSKPEQKKSSGSIKRELAAELQYKNWALKQLSDLTAATNEQIMKFKAEVLSSKYQSKELVKFI